MKFQINRLVDPGKMLGKQLFFGEESYHTASEVLLLRPECITTTIA